MQDPMLSANDLECRKGDSLLFKNINLSLSRGEGLQICGQNGSGKTSLLNILCGLSPAYTGNVYWKQQKIADCEEFKSEISYLGHKNALKLNLTVLENLYLMAGLHGCNTVDWISIVIALELKNLQNHFVYQLSAGQKQRLALARLLIRPATLWILDEPLTSLDKSGISTVKRLLQDHLQNRGMFVFTSHQTLDVVNTDIKNLHLR